MLPIALIAWPQAVTAIAKGRKRRLRSDKISNLSHL